MKNYTKSSFTFLTLALLFSTLVVSCSHQMEHAEGDSQKRSVANQSCWDSVKGEYNSYFDSVEKCIEKEPNR